MKYYNLFFLVLVAFFVQGFQYKCHAHNTDSLSLGYSLLVEAKNMPVDEGQLIVLPQQGLFISADNTFYSLDEERCTDMTKFRLLEKFPCEQVIVNDNNLITKSQQYIMLMDEEETSILAKMDTEDYILYSGIDSIVNIVALTAGDSCAWYKLDRRTGNIDYVMCTSNLIRKIVAGQNIDFCLINNTIYSVFNDQCNEFIVSDQPIIDMVLSPYGLLFCTDQRLSLIGTHGVTPLAEGEFHRLYNDGDRIYAAMKDGNIWKLDIRKNN